MKTLLAKVIPAAALVAIIATVGCQKTEQADSKDNVDTNLTDQVAQGAPGASQPENQKQAGDTPAQPSDGADFSKRVSELTRLANQAESRFEFDKAVGYWNQIAQLVQNKFGADSWQATNVKLATRTAQQQAGFDASQRKVLATAAKLQESSSESLQKNDFNGAYQNCHQASKLTKSLFGTRSYLFARMQNQLAYIASRNRQNELALSYYETALGILLQEMGEVHPEVETVYFSIAQLHQQLGQTQKAIAHYEKAATIAQQVWGSENLIYATRIHDLGVARHQNKNYKQAIEDLHVARKIREKELGLDHPQLAHNLRNLGVVYQDDLKFALAADLYQEANKIFLSRLGPENPFTLDCTTKWAITLTLLKKYPESEKVLAQLAETQKKTLAEQCGDGPNAVPPCHCAKLSG